MGECIQKMKEEYLSTLYESYSTNYFDFVSRACIQYNCRREDAEDAYHEALYATIEKVKSGENTNFTQGIISYVHSAAMNKLNDIIDHNKVHLKHCEKQKYLIELCAPGEAENKIEKEHFDAIIQQGIKKLKSEEQRIFNLFYFDKFDLEDIAVLMNYSNIRSLRNRLSDIIEKLKKIMEDAGER
jgi:RNA polymerase sigma factor (sigma-70 family)